MLGIKRSVDMNPKIPIDTYAKSCELMEGIVASVYAVLLFSSCVNNETDEYTGNSIGIEARI